MPPYLRQGTQRIRALAFQPLYLSTWYTADNQEDDDKWIMKKSILVKFLVRQALNFSCFSFPAVWMGLYVYV